MIRGRAARTGVESGSLSVCPEVFHMLTVSADDSQPQLQYSAAMSPGQAASTLCLGFGKHALGGPWSEAAQSGERQAHSSLTGPSPLTESISPGTGCRPPGGTTACPRRGWPRALISRCDQNRWPSDPTSFRGPSPRPGPTATRPFRPFNAGRPSPTWGPR